MAKKNISNRVVKTACSHRAELSILKENRFNAQKAFQYF